MAVVGDLSVFEAASVHISVSLMQCTLAIELDDTGNQVTCINIDFEFISDLVVLKLPRVYRTVFVGNSPVTAFLALRVIVNGMSIRIKLVGPYRLHRDQ